MQTYVEVEVKLHAFLILELAGPAFLLGEESAVFIGLEAE
jgi:hypothetical protein